MCMCKMNVVTVENYENLGIDVIKINNSDLFCISTGDLTKKMYATNISYLIINPLQKTNLTTLLLLKRIIKRRKI